MPFTDAECRAWHDRKRLLEQRSDFSWAEPPVATCICCQRPFGISEGSAFSEIPICDICNGD